MKCDISGCTGDPFADHAWYVAGAAPQVATLCERCGGDLFARLNPLLQTNRTVYRIDRPGAIKAERGENSPSLTGSGVT